MISGGVGMGITGGRRDRRGWGGGIMGVGGTEPRLSWPETVGGLV